MGNGFVENYNICISLSDPSQETKNGIKVLKTPHSCPISKSNKTHNLTNWGTWISLEKLEFNVPENPGGVPAPTELSCWGGFAVMCNQGHQHERVPLEPQEMLCPRTGSSAAQLCW